jgi:hypothetical protein
MCEPLLTVGIATLNRPHYLEEAIESVVTAAQRIECRIQLVVSDMGGNTESFRSYERSTLNSPSWLQCEWFSDTRIKSGIANWDNCLSRARGRYYMMIGDDDRLLPEAIIHLKAALDSRDSEPTGLLASACDIDANGGNRRTLVNPRRVYDGRVFLADVVTRKLYLRWCAFVARTKVLKSCRPFTYPFPGGGGAADGAAIISAALSGQIITLDVPISEFRVHGDNDSRAISLMYQRDQRKTLQQFVATLPQATATDQALVSVWLGTGIRFQCLRWAIQGLLDVPTLSDLEKLAHDHLDSFSGQDLPTRIRLFRAVSRMVGLLARVLTVIGFLRKSN